MKCVTCGSSNVSTSHNGKVVTCHDCGHETGAKVRWFVVLAAVLLLLAPGQGARAEDVHTLDGNVFLTCANGEGTFQGGIITFQPHGYTATVGQAGLFSVYDVAVDVYTATLSFGGIEFVKGGLTVDVVHVFGFYDDSLCNELEPTQPMRNVYLPMVVK